MLSPKEAKGIIAQTASNGADTYLRLINNSPWTSNGFFKASADKVSDMVYDCEISSGLLSGGKYEIKMKPYDVRIFKLSNASKEITCNFELPENVSSEMSEKAKHILNDKKYLEGIPGDIVFDMMSALKNKDAFALRELMDDFEVKNATANVDKERLALKNQEKLIEDLSKDKARIICASTEEYIAPKGQRWLPDQRYASCGAYGNEGASFADRGTQLDIKNTDIDRVYQTEAYGGRVVYKIPLPAGKYNIFIHFAETYIKNKTPGIRQIAVTAENIQHPELIDSFANAGGWAKAYVLEMKNIPVLDGELDLEFTGGVGVNGIEIEKAEK
jgi:hypothetical protein